MSTLGVVIVAEIPACTTILAAIVGAIYRRNRDHDDARDAALSTQSTGLAVLVAQVNPLLASVSALDLRTGHLERTTAALQATIDTAARIHPPRHRVPVRPSPGPS